jgi:hypothetical protein
MHYHIAGFRNRGTEACPFGRLELSTSSKPDGEIAGDLGVSVTPDGILDIWASNQTPANVSSLTIERARRYLFERFPALARKA